MKILIGTLNPAKQSEFKNLLENLAKKSHFYLQFITFDQEFCRPVAFIS